MKILVPLIGMLLVLSLVGCGAPPAATMEPTSTSEPSPSGSSSGGQEAGPSATLREVVLGMGFIPNIQFAPFYVADDKGYFQEDGIKVNFKYGTEDDLLKLIGTDKLQFAIGSGDQVILARSQGLPAVYVATFYRQFPVSIASLKEKNISKPQDLEGKTIGIPGLFGASYIGWLAFGHATGIDTSTVDLQSIGFTQAAALEQGRIDAAVVYIVNAPVQLRTAGRDVAELKVADYINLVSNGIITNEKTIDSEPDLVQGLVRAFLRGLRDTIEDPEEALEITLKYVPEAGGDNLVTTRAVLDASIELWRAEEPGISHEEDWTISQDFMKEIGLIDDKTDIHQLFTNTFVLAADY